jgi:hypothetical protein
VPRTNKLAKHAKAKAAKGGRAAMLVRTTAERASNSLADIGLTSGSNITVNLRKHTYQKGTEIFGESEPAEYVYQVKKGAVRTYKLLSDGRRQIGAFHLEGDAFGLTSGEVHRFTAEAIVTTTLRLLGRKNIERTAGEDRALASEMLKMTPKVYDMPKTTCCYWDARIRWNGSQPSSLRWTVG